MDKRFCNLKLQKHYPSQCVDFVLDDNLSYTTYKMKQFREFVFTTLIGGFTVILPFTIFLLILGLIFDFVRKIIDPFADLLRFIPIRSELLIDMIALAIIILFCFMVGLVMRNQYGKDFLKNIEDKTLKKLPLYPSIKNTVQQFLGRQKIPFQKVVIVDVFGNETRMLGFVVDEHASQHLTIFVPTGPNPTNGFIFHVSPEQVKELDMKPDEAMRIIIGVGVGLSDHV